MRTLWSMKVISHSPHIFISWLFTSCALLFRLSFYRTISDMATVLFWLKWLSQVCYWPWYLTSFLRWHVKFSLYVNMTWRLYLGLGFWIVLDSSKSSTLLYWHKLSWFLRGYYGSPLFPKILNKSPILGCCLDWQCFLSLFGSHETLPVILKYFDSE